MPTVAGTLVLLLALLGFIQVPPPAVVQSVELAVPVPPVSFRQGDRDHLVYELHITNFQQVDVVLSAVRVDGPRGVLAEYRDAVLHRLITRPGFRFDHPAPQVLAPGARAIVNIWMPMGNGVAATSALRHAVDLTVQRKDQPVAVTVTGAAVDVSTAPVPTLDPPLGDGQWVAIYDPLLMGGHRASIYTLDGRARIPGRFAIDFIALPPNGALARDKAARPPAGNGFGANVLAVADGTIGVAVDGVADHAPQPVPAGIAAGNHVSIDLGGRRFVFYEHLQRGSVRVKAGQRVRRGDVLAKLGASGSTSMGAHLHFHVADANATLAAEGMPFVFRNFTMLGEFASIGALLAGESWIPGQLARPVSQSRPTPNAVISFR
jgi:murein DD-endopeptidase